MKSNEKKVTLREALSLNTRALREIRRHSPRLLLSMVLHGAAQVLAPYVTVYLSARILEELAGPCRAGVLWRLAALALGSAAVLTLLTGLLLRWKNYQINCFSGSRYPIYSRKLHSLDYASLDDAATMDLYAQVQQNENWGGWGYWCCVKRTAQLVQALFGAAGAVTLTVSLFTLPVPAGPYAWLDSPLFLAALVAALALTAVLGPLCSARAESYQGKFGEEARMGNRLFAAFGWLPANQDNAEDMRMYRQQNMLLYYMDKNPFGSRGPWAPLSRGPVGRWAALGGGIGAVLTGLVYVFVCLKAWAGAFGVGLVTQYVGAITALTDSVSNAIQALGGLAANTPFLRTLYQFMDIPNEMYQGSLTTEKRADRQYEVEFRDVSFQYPGSDLWALRHVNMKFRVGSRLAVVGPNGSGKSTFIKLLCRLYDPTEGQILLNGIDIRKYRYDDYIDIFAVVFQDFRLLSQPLGANVAAGAEYDRVRVAACLRDAGFADRLEALPDGLDTMLYKGYTGEGVEPSGGETQKIAIARALYKDAPFIILDVNCSKG